MPGINVSYHYSSLNTETTKFFTYIIIVLNVIFTVLGAMMFSMGIYMLLDHDFRRWVKDLEMEHYWIGVYILLGAGILVILQSFFGICGAYQKKRGLLWVFAVGLVLAFILEIAGAVYMLLNGIRFSNIEDWLHHKFLRLIAESQFDVQARRILDIVQEWVGCCGADGVQDYIRWNKVIPTTCYDPVNGNAWYQKGYGYVGCVRGFTWYLESMTGMISGCALFLAFLQIFAFVATLLLICVKKDFKSKSQLNLNR